jgi:hypothetical protein
MYVEKALVRGDSTLEAGPKPPERDGYRAVLQGSIVRAVSFECLAAAGGGLLGVVAHVPHDPAPQAAVLLRWHAHVLDRRDPLVTAERHPSVYPALFDTRDLIRTNLRHTLRVTTEGAR